MKHMDRVSLNERSIQALEIAEKGVAQAMYELTRKTDLDQTSGIGNVAGAFDGGLFQCAATTRPDNRFLLRSRGTFKGVVREIAVLVAGSSGSWAAQGIAARGNLEVTGQFNVDSYDSSAGTYASQAVNGNAGDTYANSDAKLSSNASIDAGPNAVVRGDLRPGPDGVLTIHRRTFISGQAEIQGAVVGNTVTLKCVDFHFDESLIQENDLQPVGSNGIATYSRVAWIEPNQPGY
jgi:hypothetical protein